MSCVGLADLPLQPVARHKKNGLLQVFLGLFVVVAP